MSAANKQVVRDYLKAYDQLDWDAWERLKHRDHVFHFPFAPEPLDGAGHRAMNEDFRQAFPTMEHVIEEMIAEGDLVTVRGTVRMTHEGEFQGFAPTGKTIDVNFMLFARIDDGKTREEWVELDSMAFMNALQAGSA